MIATGIVDGRAWIVGYHPRYASQGFRVGAYAYAELTARTVADFRGVTGSSSRSISTKNGSSAGVAARSLNVMNELRDDWIRSP